MKIEVTLTELKTYFETWHKNISHKDKIKETIDEYLNEIKDSNNISFRDKIESVTGLTESIITILKTLLLIEGNADDISSLTSLSDLKNRVDALKNSLTVNNLKKLSDRISELDRNKPNYSYVDGKIEAIQGLTGVKPITKLASQLIPVQELGNDLNNYSIPGIYRRDKADVTVVHGPNIGAVPFTLVVIETVQQSVNDKERYSVRQLLLLNSSSEEGNRIFSRNYTLSNNTWGAWTELYGTHNTRPLQMKVEWEESNGQLSDPTIYTLLQIKQEGE